MPTDSIAAPLYLPLRGSPAILTWSPLLETRRSGTGDQGVRVLEWGWLSYRGASSHCQNGLTSSSGPTNI